MSGEVEQGTEESQETTSIVDEPSSEREERATDATISSLFRHDQEDELEEDSNEEEKEDIVQQTNNTPIGQLSPETQSRLDAMLEKQGELTATNQILMRQLDELRRGQQRPQVTTDDDDEVDLDELNAQIQANPAKAFLDLVNKVIPKVAKKSETQAARVAAEISNTQAAYQQDRARAETEFKDHWGKNPEFDQLADAYYREFVANSPIVSEQGHRYHKGAVYAAMSAAYGDLVRQGKIKTGPSNVVTLRERKSPPSNNTLTPEQRPGETNDEAVVFKGLTAAEVKGMKKAAAALGVSWAEYKKDWERSTRRDPSYGGRRG